jgi:NDP-sugar pyrophosphorylase family protein
VNTLPATPRFDHCLAPVDVLVLAGGLGTRIRPVLGDTPKLLAPLAGRPYVDYLIDWLRGFGARRVLLGLGHRAEAVVEYIRAHPRPDLEVSHLIEPQPLGTAGAIRFARSRLHSDPVMVINGDSFADADICGMVARQRDCQASGTVLCAEVEDAGRYGRVVIDETGAICDFIEKDSAFHGPALVNAGIYLLSADLLDQIAADQSVSLESDVFERLPPRSLAAFTGRFQFIDIGTPESLELAQAIFESRDDSILRAGRPR